MDGAGNLFIVNRGNFRIRRVSPNGIIATVAGNGTNGFSGDGGPATIAQFDYAAFGVAVDGAGNLFISDNHRIRMVSTDGVITTVAGGNVSCTIIEFVCAGDGGPATSAPLVVAAGVGVDGRGNLFIVDQYRIRKVSTDGIITTQDELAALGLDCGPRRPARF